MDLKEVIGEQVKFYKERKRIKPEELTSRVGISLSDLDRIEKGEIYPAWEIFQRLTCALDIPDEALLRESHKRRESANIMVCSKCGTIIAKKKSERGLFDIFDSSWTCPGCNGIWYSSDGWTEVGDLLIPFR